MSASQQVVLSTKLAPGGALTVTAHDVATAARVGRLIADGPYQAPDGRRVMQVISAYVGPGVLQRSSHPSYSSNLQRCGIGTSLYRAAFEFSAELGLPLASDERYRLSEAARGWWRKQVAAGLAGVIEDPDDPDMSVYLLTRAP